MIGRLSAGVEIGQADPSPARPSPSSPHTRAVLEACAAACKACGDECAGHASMHEHCPVCSGTCRRCEAACRELLANLD